jgi:hypothetical protein
MVDIRIMYKLYSHTDGNYYDQSQLDQLEDHVLEVVIEERR